MSIDRKEIDLLIFISQTPDYRSPSTGIILQDRLGLSKYTSTAFLFGDAGSACLIEKDEQSGKSFFSLHLDGKRHNYIMIKGGGYRYPSSIETVKEKLYNDGNIRTDEQGVMDGDGIFEFTITDALKNIARTMERVQDNNDTIDIFLLHQANIFITDIL